MAIKPKILLAEDDLNLGFVIRDNLEMNGFEVILCENGEEFLIQFKEETADLCILDIMMPKLDGFSVAEQIRKINSEIPIIFLTAKSLKEDKLKGLKLGADDYITKPFNIEELILKIKIFLKRSKVTYKDESVKIQSIQMGGYLLDVSNQLLHYGESKQQLTLKEAELINMFFENPNAVLKREDILNQIWKDDNYFVGRSLDVFISRLRKYLKSDGRIKLLNIHGVGFKLEYSS
jgi:DNA-binding response OmpR family regulator